jgi:phage terminase large subunit-like protein
VAEKLGVPLMGWQQFAVDTALEHDAAGRLAYRDVGVATPRQSGKSTLLLALIIWRLLSAPGQKATYAAQTRLAGRTRLFDSWWPRIRRSGLRDMFSLSKATGAEALRCANGSMLGLLSTEQSGGHGDTLDLAILDEAWALDAAAEQAVKPATITRPAAQIWCVSTAGTYQSRFWRSKVDAGRLVATTGLTEGYCFQEWSAPDEADPTDERTWFACMPALGVTVEPSVIRADMATMEISEFRRAYLNQWPEVAQEGWRVIAKDDWAAATQW